jgi:RHS repeat-associated protein
MLPPTPAGPVPAVFPYVAKSSSATQTSDKLTIGGHPVLVKGSVMDVEQPGNQPAAPPGTGDVVTHAVCGKATTTSGSSRVTAGGKPICATGDSVAHNAQAPGGTVTQAHGTLVKGVDGNTSSASADSGAADVCVKDPVAVATGEVVNDAVDLALPGLIPVEWKRFYRSGWLDETTPLGRGKWTHGFNQWIEPAEKGLTLRKEDGRKITFGPVTLREPAFHRGKRLRLSLLRDSSFEVYSLDTRLTRRFAPLAKGDARAVLREIRDAWGNRVELVYFGTRLARVVDTAGRELRLTYDATGRIVRVDAWAQGKTHQAVTYAYDEVDGDLISATDALGYAERYAYDAWHRMTEKTLPNGICFHYAYDPDTGRCRETWGTGATHTGKWSDGGLHGGVFEVDLAKRKSVVHGSEEPRIYFWNEQGAMLREQTYDATWLKEKAYDADLFVTAEKNAAGETTAYAYDELGNRVQITDPAGNVTRWRFDEEIPMERIGPDGLSTKYRHDMRGALVEVDYPNGESFALDYDNKGRLLAIFGKEGRRAAFAYDGAHNLVEETDARGGRWCYAYDPLGRPVARVDPLGRVTRVTYDLLGRPVAIERPDGTETRMEYDALGNVTKHTDPLGHVTTMEYAGTGALVKQTRDEGYEWTFEYDSIERLRRIVNPMAERYDFDYDRAGRVRKEVTFDGRQLDYQHDLAGRLSRIENPDHTWRTFHYDPLGNVLREKSSHGDEVFDRDDLGRLQKATIIEHNGKTVVAFERDALGRIVAEKQGERTITYELDARGRRTARTLPNGETTRYGYDVMGALIAVTHAKQRIDIERDVMGREVKRHANGGVEISSAYDAADRLVEQKVTAPTSKGAEVNDVMVERAWRYDAAGRVRAIADARWGTTLYEYDDLGQLIEAKRGKHAEVFDYDASGSLYAVLKNLSERERFVPWDIGMGNLLYRTKTAEHTYDKNHRRHTMQDDKTGAVTTYLWDCRDRMREVRFPDGRRALYTYDAFGRRVRKEIVPAIVVADLAKGKGPEVQVTEFLWDGNALAVELSSEHGARVHVHAPGTLVPMLQAEGGEVFAVVCDHLGMPKELLGQDGRVAWAAAHSAWGRVVEVKRAANVAGARPLESPFRLLGQYADEETGLCYTRFRYFDPQHGRWMSPDPLGVFGGLNLLAFDGTPTVDVDPWGLACERLPQGFADQEQFKTFGAIIRKWLKGLTDYYEAFIGGSAASGKNFHTGEPFNGDSDIDLGIVSKDLVECVDEAALRGNGTRTAPNPLPMLQPMTDELSDLMGRQVDVALYKNSGTAAARNPVRIPVPD